jgi:hypothetical protein
MFTVKSLLRIGTQLCAVVIVISLVMLVGCGSGTKAHDTDERKVDENLAKPFLIAILDDKTMSFPEGDIASLDISDVRRPAQRLMETSGEIAYGVIDENADARLFRVRIPPKPGKIERSTNQNVLLRYREDSKRRDEYEKNEQDIQHWKQESADRIDRWCDSIEPLLPLPRDARMTDFNGAVDRALLFLSEDCSIWHSEPVKVLIIISDCQDNRGRGIPDIPTDVLVVHITNLEGKEALSQFNAKTFESASAAIDYVLQLMD